MLDNFLTDEDEARDNKGLVWQKNSEGIVDKKKRATWMFKEKGNKKDTYSLNQKEIVEISRMHNEKGGLGKFDTRRTYCRWDVHRQLSNLPNKLL